MSCLPYKMGGISRFSYHLCRATPFCSLRRKDPPRELWIWPDLFYFIASCMWAARVRGRGNPLYSQAARYRSRDDGGGVEMRAKRGEFMSLCQRSSFSLIRLLWLSLEGSWGLVAVSFLPLFLIHLLSDASFFMIDLKVALVEKKEKKTQKTTTWIRCVTARKVVVFH